MEKLGFVANVTALVAARDGIIDYGRSTLYPTAEEWAACPLAIREWLVGRREVGVDLATASPSWAALVEAAHAAREREEREEREFDAAQAAQAAQAAAAEAAQAAKAAETAQALAAWLHQLGHARILRGMREGYDVASGVARVLGEHLGRSLEEHVIAALGRPPSRLQPEVRWIIEGTDAWDRHWWAPRNDPSLVAFAVHDAVQAWLASAAEPWRSLLRVERIARVESGDDAYTGIVVQLLWPPGLPQLDVAWIVSAE